MDITYPARLAEQEGGYFVEFIDLPDTFTEGGTIEEALFNAAEVYRACSDGVSTRTSPSRFQRGN